MAEFSAIIKIAPVVSVERADATFYGNSLQLLPTGDVPLLLDHDRGTRLGTIDRLVELDSVDGRWLAAIATIDGERAAFLKTRTHTPASFGFHPVHRNEHDGRVSRAFVAEVSLLIATEPLEPGAELVALVERSTSPTARRTSDHADEEIIHTTAVITRPSGVVLGIR